jgi:hypothetical protein
MSKYKGLNGNRLEQIEYWLETSEELLDAIETVSGELFKENNPGSAESNIIDNKASEIWQDPEGREDEILAEIPVDSAEKDDVVFWGAEGKFAEFDGEKWIACE